MFVGPMQLQEPSVYMGNDRLSFLSDVGRKSNIKMGKGIFVMTSMPDLRS
jgi:hypothetical protein